MINILTVRGVSYLVTSVDLCGVYLSHKLMDVIDIIIYLPYSQGADGLTEWMTSMLVLLGAYVGWRLCF